MALSLEPGFLDFDNLPDTNFSCVGKVIGGYYADLETNCQMFHVCTIGQLEEPMDIRFLCLNGTVFDQETRVCERIDEVDCSKSEQFYSLNLELYGNTQSAILEESPDAQETEQPLIIKSTPSTTTTTTTTTKRPTTRTTRLPYYSTTATPTLTTATNPQVISTHHFPVNSPDIRFNPEEINISLNPGAPPNIRTKPLSYQSQSSSDSSRVIVTTHNTVQVLPNQRLENRPYSSSTTRNPAKSVYSVNNNSNNNNKHIPQSAISSDINFGFEFNKENVEPNTEPPPAQYHYETNLGGYRHRQQSFPPPEHYLHTTPKQHSYQQNKSPTTLRTIIYHHTPTHHHPHHYIPPMIEKTPQRVQIPLPLLPTLPPLTFSSPAPFTLQRHFETKRYTKDHQAPPRIIISASASVSDDSGRRLNYSLGTIGAAQILDAPPATYDEYKDSDVGLDPFYHDVPKIKQRERRSVDDIEADLPVNPFDIIKDEKDARDVLRFLVHWYKSHQATATFAPITIPVHPETITEINHKLAPNVEAPLLTESSEIHFTNSKEITTQKIDSAAENFKGSDLFRKNSKFNILGVYKNVEKQVENNGKQTQEEEYYEPVSENKRAKEINSGVTLNKNQQEKNRNYSDEKPQFNDEQESVVTTHLNSDQNTRINADNFYEYVDDNYEPVVYKQNEKPNSYREDIKKYFVSPETTSAGARTHEESQDVTNVNKDKNLASVTVNYVKETSASQVASDNLYNSKQEHANGNTALTATETPSFSIQSNTSSKDEYQKTKEPITYTEINILSEVNDSEVLSRAPIRTPKVSHSASSTTTEESVVEIHLDETTTSTTTTTVRPRKRTRGRVRYHPFNQETEKTNHRKPTSNEHKLRTSTNMKNEEQSKNDSNLYHKTLSSELVTRLLENTNQPQERPSRKRGRGRHRLVNNKANNNNANQEGSENGRSGYSSSHIDVEHTLTSTTESSQPTVEQSYTAHFDENNNKDTNTLYHAEELTTYLTTLLRKDETITPETTLEVTTETEHIRNTNEKKSNLNDSELQSSLKKHNSLLPLDLTVMPTDITAVTSRISASRDDFFMYEEPPGYKLEELEEDIEKELNNLKFFSGNKNLKYVDVVPSTTTEKPKPLLILQEDSTTETSPVTTTEPVATTNPSTEILKPKNDTADKNNTEEKSDDEPEPLFYRRRGTTVEKKSNINKYSLTFNEETTDKADKAMKWPDDQYAFKANSKYTAPKETSKSDAHSFKHDSKNTAPKESGKYDGRSFNHDSKHSVPKESSKYDHRFKPSSFTSNLGEKTTTDRFTPQPSFVSTLGEDTTMSMDINDRTPWHDNDYVLNTHDTIANNKHYEEDGDKFFSEMFGHMTESDKIGTGGYDHSHTWPLPPRMFEPITRPEIIFDNINTDYNTDTLADYTKPIVNQRTTTTSTTTTEKPTIKRRRGKKKFPESAIQKQSVDVTTNEPLINKENIDTVLTTAAPVTETSVYNMDLQIADHLTKITDFNTERINPNLYEFSTPRYYNPNFSIEKNIQDLKHKPTATTQQDAESTVPYNSEIESNTHTTLIKEETTFTSYGDIVNSTPSSYESTLHTSDKTETSDEKTIPVDSTETSTLSSTTKKLIEPLNLEDKSNYRNTATVEITTLPSSTKLTYDDHQKLSSTSHVHSTTTEPIPVSSVVKFTEVPTTVLPTALLITESLPDLIKEIEISTKSVVENKTSQKYSGTVDVINLTELFTKPHYTTLTESFTKPQHTSSTELQQTSLTEFSTEPQHTSLTELSTEPQHTSFTEFSTKPQHASLTESFTKPQHTSITDSFTKPQHTSITDSFTKPQHTSSTDSFTKPQHTSITDSFTKPQQKSITDSFTKPQHISITDSFTIPPQISLTESSKKPQHISLSESFTKFQHIMVTKPSATVTATEANEVTERVTESLAAETKLISTTSSTTTSTTTTPKPDWRTRPTRRTRPTKRKPERQRNFGRHRFRTEVATPTSEIQKENIEHEVVNALEKHFSLSKDRKSFEAVSTDSSLAKSANPTQPQANNVGSGQTTPLYGTKYVARRPYMFNCFGRDINKFYADPRDCRLFHYCTQGYSKNQLLDMKFVCDLETYFDDEKLICSKVKPSRCV